MSAPAPVALACPDCGARPAWVHDPTGWAKCSRCELAWPALERRFRGAPPKGAVVTLPDAWRLRRTKPGDGYRSEAKRPELAVELPPPLPFNSVILFGLTMFMAFVAISAARNAGTEPLVVGSGLLALVGGVAGVISFLRRPRRGLEVTFVGDRVHVSRGGEPPRDHGRLVGLRVVAHGGEGGFDLLMDTTTERSLRVVAPGTGAQVETLMREIGRHAGLMFERRHGALVARSKPEPARVRAQDAASLGDTAGEREPSDAGAETAGEAEPSDPDADASEPRRAERRR